IRGSAACPALKVPKAELPLSLSNALIWSVPFTAPVLVLSGAKFGWLRMLKYSTRSWSFTRSVKEKYLESCMSQFTVRGSRRTFFPILPKAPNMAGVFFAFLPGGGGGRPGGGGDFWGARKGAGGPPPHDVGGARQRH